MPVKIFNEHADYKYRITSQSLNVPDGSTSATAFISLPENNYGSKQGKYMYFNEFEIDKDSKTASFPDIYLAQSFLLYTGQSLDVQYVFKDSNNKEIKTQKYSVIVPEHEYDSDDDGLWRIRWIIAFLCGMLVVIYRAKFFGEASNFAIVGLGAIAATFAGGFTAGLIGELTGLY